MKKSLLIFLILITCCFAVMGCTKEERKKQEEEPIVGGWDVEITETQATIEKEALDAFERAISKEEKKYRPVALLGKQIVAGTNYMFLAVEEEKSYRMITIYNDLQNESEILYNNPIDFTKYMNQEISYNEINAVAGGWNIDLPEQGEELDIEVKLAFENAVKKLPDATYYPITVVGRQLVSGTNYAVLCLGKVNENTGAYILTLYVDLNDKQEITSSAYIDLTEYTK